MNKSERKELNRIKNDLEYSLNTFVLNESKLVRIKYAVEDIGELLGDKKDQEKEQDLCEDTNTGEHYELCLNVENKKEYFKNLRD